jgi:hypothetical protein
VGAAGCGERVLRETVLGAGRVEQGVLGGGKRGRARRGLY